MARNELRRSVDVESPGSNAVSFGILGPLEATVAGRRLALGGPRNLVLLGILLANAHRLVPVDHLIDAIWDDLPPDTARRQLQNCVSALRRVFADAGVHEPVIVADGQSYCMRPAAGTLDAEIFAAEVTAATRHAQNGDTERAAAGLLAALNRWRGPALLGLSGRIVEAAAARLNEQRLAAVEQRFELELGLGRHRAVIGELSDLVTANPLRERLVGHLLVALSRSGRQAEAVHVYQRLRKELADELGIDPGAAVQQIYTSILASETEEARPATRPQRPVPAQLPTDVSGFTGRAAHLTALDEVLAEPASAVAVAAIAGMAGIGKTALAVHWAHEVADRFPDGQLYVNLRGFHPSGRAVAPAEAVRGFLDALGVPPSRIPSDVDGQVGLYRSTVAGRRLLVVLDNARDPDQVRPLLPGSPSCVVVVTSRSRMTGLAATEAARPLILDVLPDGEARDLLAARLGAERVVAEPDATDAIVARCAGLPLALAVAAARAATSSLPLAAVADQLADEESTLDTLDIGDPVADARVVFSWSYRTLTPAAARLFRLLGLHHGPDIATSAVASLVGVAPAQARVLLAELAGAHLVTPHPSDRYSVHDLLRAYAAELALANDDEAERRSAVHRLLDHYLHSAHAAARVLHPQRDPVPVEPARQGVTTESPADREQALAWLTAEHRVLLTALEHAAATGFDGHAWQIAWAVADFLHRRGHWHEWRETQYVALEAARRLSDRRGQAVAHRGIAMACSNLGRHAEAEPHVSRALELYGHLGDRLGQAHTHLNASASMSRQDRHAEALHHCERALELHRAMNDRTGEAKVLNSLGFAYARLGNYEQALVHCQQAAELHGQLPDRHGLAHTLDSLGFVHLRLGSHREAVRYYQRSATLFEELGSRFFHAETLVNLGDAYDAAGEPVNARRAWRQALGMLDESAHPWADEVRDRLSG
jgi:DNA-binding SARP family transcriptional activator/tetratricopeptide (TPR) repeat protein